MNHILLTTLASVAFTIATVSQSSANPATHDVSQPATPSGQEHVEHTHAAKLAEDMAREIEDRFAKLKDAGAGLADEFKSEFNYYMDVITAEIKALKDSTNTHHKKHHTLAQRALHAAESMIKKISQQAENLKKVEERKAAKSAKAEERKARAAERKAKAEARKAEREAARAKKKADKAHIVANEQEKAHEKLMEKAQADELAQADKQGKLDHGRSEGGSTAEPGSEAAKPASEDKK